MSKQAIASELIWIEALGKTDLNLPEVIPGKNDQLFAEIFIEGEKDTRVVDVFAWIDGTTLTEHLEDISRDELVPLFKKIGKTAAKLHQHSSTWKPPEAFQRHAWDIDGLLGETPFWGQFWNLKLLNMEQKEFVLKTKAVLRDYLQDYFSTPDTYGLIHADMIPDNLMLSGDDLYIIDFDDAGFGYYLFDIATILRPVQDYPFYGTAKQALLDGYQMEKALDFHYLEAFEVARALTYLGWYHDRPELLRAKPESVKRAISKAVQKCRDFLAVHES